MSTVVHNDRLKCMATPEVLIPTATAIVCDSEDPWRILIGTSTKHEKPVLPGGKIDSADLVSSSLERCAAECIRRELREEIGCEPLTLRMLSVSSDRKRDVRTVALCTLSGSIAAQAVEMLNPDSMVTGRYGVPDFLFIAMIEAGAVQDTAELKHLTWVDCRTIQRESLSAGHSAFVERYLKSLGAGG